MIFALISFDGSDCMISLRHTYGEDRDFGSLDDFDPRHPTPREHNTTILWAFGLGSDHFVFDGMDGFLGTSNTCLYLHGEIMIDR